MRTPPRLSVTACGTAWMRVGVVVVACTLAACAAFFSQTGPRASRDDIKAPHERHKKGSVDCIACHEEVYDATTLEGKLSPGEDKCLECHREEKDKGNCGFCHLDAKHPGKRAKAERHMTFNHAAHMPRTKEDCTVCHKALPEPLPSAATRATPMAACFDCHEHKKQVQSSRCDSCHVDLGRYPVRPISMFSHQSNYLQEHGRNARTGGDACAQCHEQTFCADCHSRTVATKVETKLPERVDRFFIHRNDFISRHSLEAKGDSASCQRCHGQSFCQNCHEAQNLTKQSVNPRNPHAAGFARNHGVEARRDIASCASCHDQGAQSNCVDCHRVGGIGKSPHPPGWTSRHTKDEIGRNSMCGYCHL